MPVVPSLALLFPTLRSWVVPKEASAITEWVGVGPNMFTGGQVRNSAPRLDAARARLEFHVA
jgi:hypothetical protein